jgi:hypothetical protein
MFDLVGASPVLVGQGMVEIPERVSHLGSSGLTASANPGRRGSRIKQNNTAAPSSLADGLFMIGLAAKITLAGGGSRFLLSWYNRSHKHFFLRGLWFL